MSEENQKFSYNTFASRVVEQAAKVLPYFDRGSAEHALAAALFKSVEDTVKQAQEASHEPMLERHLINEAWNDVARLQDCLRALGAPTDLEVAFGREMGLIWDRYFELAEQYPTLEEQELLLMEEQELLNPGSAARPPKEWGEEVLKKIREETENPTIRRRH